MARVGEGTLAGRGGMITNVPREGIIGVKIWPGGGIGVSRGSPINSAGRSGKADSSGAGGQREQPRPKTTRREERTKRRAAIV